MPREYLLYIEDILSSSKKITRYVGDYSFVQFLKDERTVDAVMRNFEIIGIAAYNIPQEVKDRHMEIEWRKIYLFRNVLAHEYFGIDKEVLWGIITKKIPKLVAQMEVVLNKES